MDLEGGLVEEELQLLVGEVDEQLLEGVGLHVLEAEDVQDADEGRGGSGVLVKGCVQARHQKVKEPVVEGLGQSVARVPGLCVRQR